MLGMMRVIVGGVLLLIAAIMDVREREISDVVWILMGISAAFFAIIDLMMGEFFLSSLMLSLGFACVMGVLLYFLRFGGADIKALFAISLLYVDYPAFFSFPLGGVPPLGVFVMSVLTNAVIFGLSVPIFFFVMNAFRRNFSPLMFLGMKVPADSLRERRHIRLMHSDSKYVCGGVELSDDVLRKIEQLHREGIMREVWITPELPFIVFIALGFFTAFLFGDLIAILLRF